MSTTEAELNQWTDRFFQVAEQADWKTWAALFTTDALIGQNGTEHTVDNLIAMVGSLPRPVYGDVRRVVSAADRSVCEQHSVSMTRGSASVSVEVCVVLRYSADGLVERADEYVDPAGFMPLFSG